VTFDRVLSYGLSLLLVAFGMPFLLLGAAPLLGGIDYNPEFDALGTPLGLGFLYGALYNLQLTHPPNPLDRQTGIRAGMPRELDWLPRTCHGLERARSAVGASLVRSIRGGIRWIFLVGVPFGLAWFVRAIRNGLRPPRR